MGVSFQVFASKPTKSGSVGMCIVGQQFKTGLEAEMCISTLSAQCTTPVPE